MFSRPCFALPLFLTATGTCLARGQAYCTKVPPSVVIVYSGPAKSFHLIHQGHPVPFGLLTQMQPQDRLEIDDPSALVTIEDAASHTSSYGATYSPLCVQEGNQISIAENLLKVLQAHLKRADDSSQRSLSARGDSAPLALEMYSLRSGIARVGAGTRSFAVSWRGGAGPFHLTVYDPMQQSVVDEANLKSHSLRKGSRFSLVPGRYQIRLTDAKNNTVTGSFVAGNQVFPTLQTEEAASDANRIEQVARVLQSHPDRSYDAYLWLSSEEDRPAVQALMDALALSDTPPEVSTSNK